MLKWLKEKGKWLLAIILAFLAGLIGAASRKPPQRPLAREVDKEIGRAEQLAKQTDDLIALERQKLEERKEKMRELKRKLERMSNPAGVKHQ